MSICKKVQSVTHFNSPIRMECWDTHKKVGMQDSPSGVKTASGNIKRVNKCVAK